jgi:hypothetical protein
MPPIVVKLLPQAIVLAVVLYWAWPAMTTPAPKALEASTAGKKTAEKPAFPASVLTPEFAAPSKRDPFFRADATHNHKKNKMLAGAKRNENKSNKSTSHFTDLGLVLTATCIVGDHRMALINGRLYREKETVTDASANCIVTKIEPHQVTMSYNGRQFDLCYTNGAEKKPASNGAASKK